MNIRREKYRIDGGNGAEHLAATTVSDEELLLAIEYEFELNDGKFHSKVSTKQESQIY